MDLVRREPKAPIAPEHVSMRREARRSMKSASLGISAAALVVLLAACAGEPHTYNVGAAGVMMPKGTISGAASVGDANALAQMIVASHNDAMAKFDSVHAAQQQALQNSEAALTSLEQLSAQQGSGQLTLFFSTGSATLDDKQQQRLIRFLDYISVKSNGRPVILVSIGSASAIGSAAINHRLSIERSQAPVRTIDKYLVNTPHRFYKVAGVGDMYAPKDASFEVDQRYQNVRLIAAYNEAQLPPS
jgi:outer membrane protein OmpA-like peptidoglycan-associated protein